MQQGVGAPWKNSGVRRPLKVRALMSTQSSRLGLLLPHARADGSICTAYKKERPISANPY
jgi:hypothetical protein